MRAVYTFIVGIVKNGLESPIREERGSPAKRKMSPDFSDAIKKLYPEISESIKRGAKVTLVTP